jgi:thioredoxin reductase (NADPH)
VPNRLGIPGEDLPHVSHYYREAHSQYRRRVVIVGGKNSAAEAALEMYRAGAQVLIVHRGAALGDSIKYWVKPDIENRIKEGAIGARFNTTVTRITDADVILNGPDGEVRQPADAVLLLTGFRSDPVLLRSVGAAIDPDTGAPVTTRRRSRRTCLASSSSAPSLPASRADGSSSRTDAFTGKW